ncbi:MAG TPA: MMPL family transporter [Candidatus Binataceae bacterium]|nr:MMPL family transporter [Candidatus Binataceae bacterium]
MDIIDVGEAVLRFRRAIGAVLVAATLFMVYAAAQMNISTSFIDFFPAEHNNVTLAKRFYGFGGAQTLILMLQVKQGDIFNLGTLRKIQKITGEVDWLPGVIHQQVYSLSSQRVSYAQVVPGGLNVRPFMFPWVPRNETEIEMLRQRIFAHREQLRHLISDDNKSTLITASISDSDSFNGDGLDYRELFEDISRIVANNRDARHDIFIAGEPMVRGYGYYHLPAILSIFFVACLIIVLVLYANLGAYSSWWVPLLTGSCSALWGLGFIGLMGYRFDPLMLVVPFILTARDMSHAIAWQRRYYRVLNELEDRYAACVRTTALLLMPGLVAIAADITGIVFISFSGIPVLDHIARAGVVWLGASLLMVFVFQPILMSYLSMPRHTGNFERNRELTRCFEPLVERIVEVPVTPGWTRRLLLSGAVGLLILGVNSALKIQVGYNHAGTPLYRPDAKVNTDAEAIGRKFPVDEGWVLLNTPSYPHAQSVLAPNVLRLADHLRSSLLNDPAVKQVISFSSTVICPFDQMLHYGHPKFFGIPKNAQQAGNLWYLFLGGTAPGEMQNYIPNSDAKLTCIRVMLRDHTAPTLSRIQDEIGAFLTSYAAGKPAYSRVTVSYMAGLAGLYAAANDVLYRVTMVNIALVLACIFIFCTVLFGSLLAGLLFVFACVLANFTAFTYMYLSGIQLTIDSVPVISLAIGLGIDYGISTVSCIRAEVIAGHQLDDAVWLALQSAGHSVLSTFCVMIGGIVPWVFSPAQFHHQMSTLLTILLSTNVLAEVWIVPSFISWSRPGFITRHEWVHEEGVERRTATAEGLAIS